MGNFFHPHHPGISSTSSPRRQNGGITRRPTNGNSLPVAVTCHWWRSSGEKILTHLLRKGILFLCSLSSPGKVAKNVGLTLAHRPHPPTSHGHMARADEQKIQRTQQRMQFHPGLSKMGPACLATIPWEKQD